MAGNTRLQVRRGSGVSWTTADPALYAGELGLNLNNKLLKVGDGSIAWSSLGYYGIPIASGSGIQFVYTNDSDGNPELITIHNAIRAGSNISLTESNGYITIAGSSPTTLSEGTGIVIEQSGDDYTINADYTNASFISAVDARVTAGSISDESVRDIMATGITGGTGILVTYDDDGDEKIHINMTGLALSGHTHVLTNITDVTATAAEVNLIDGDTSSSSVGLAGTDGVIVNDGGVMKLAQVGDFGAYEASTTRTLTNKTINGPDNTLTNIAPTSLTASGVTVGSTTINLGETSTTLAGLTSVTATTFNGALNGNASTATEATNVTAVANNSTDETVYLTFVDGATGTQGIETDTALTYNPSSNLLSVGSITTTSNVTIGGDLTVAGTTTTVNSTTVEIGDNVIRLNTSGLSTGGIEVKDGSNATYKQLIWSNTADRWEFAGGENVYTSGSITANSFAGDGSSITNLDFNNIASNIPDPIITGVLTGDVSGSASVTLTDLGNGTLTINTTLGNGVVSNANVATNAAIDVFKLSASGITLGSTTINLGETSTVIDGLTRISGVSWASPVYIHYAVIDGGSP